MRGYDEWLEEPYQREDREFPERDPDAEREDREEQRRMAAEMDGPHEEGL